MEKAEMLKAAKRNRRLCDELTKAVMPLLEFLNRHGPHAYTIVTEGRVEIVRGEVSALLPVRD
jgi:hypothetical protein